MVSIAEHEANAVNKAIMLCSSQLRRAIGGTQPQELLAEWFGGHVIHYDKYKCLENIRMDGLLKGELVEKIASTVEGVIENNPLKLVCVINSVRRFGSLHIVFKRIKYEYGNFAVFSCWLVATFIFFVF